MSASATQGGHKEEERKKPQDKNILTCPISQSGHKEERKKKKPEDENIMSASATQGGHKKMRLLCFVILPGGTEALITRGVKTRHYLIAHFLRTFMSKSLKLVNVCGNYSKSKEGRF